MNAKVSLQLKTVLSCPSSHDLNLVLSSSWCLHGMFWLDTRAGTWDNNVLGAAFSTEIFSIGALLGSARAILPLIVWLGAGGISKLYISWENCLCVVINLLVPSPPANLSLSKICDTGVKYCWQRCCSMNVFVHPTSVYLPPLIYCV